MNLCLDRKIRDFCVYWRIKIEAIKLIKLHYIIRINRLIYIIRCTILKMKIK